MSHGVWAGCWQTATMFTSVFDHPGVDMGGRTWLPTHYDCQHLVLTVQQERSDTTAFLAPSRGPILKSNYQWSCSQQRALGIRETVFWVPRRILSPACLEV